MLNRKKEKIKKLENGKKICYNVKQLKHKISNLKLDSDIKKYTDVLMPLASHTHQYKVTLTGTYL